MCVHYVGRWELLGVVYQVVVVPYQHVVLFHPECCHYQDQAAFEESVFGSTKIPKIS